MKKMHDDLISSIEEILSISDSKIKDPVLFSEAAKYFESFITRAAPFDVCSEIKQVERIDELESIYEDLVLASRM
jgi:hypothetical protein|tara:strand:- start:168 stop:392 length:225 start_codon:yes stop_codon:yes gene_type:complete